MPRIPDYHPTFEGQLRAILRSLEVLMIEVKELNALYPSEETQPVIESTTELVSATTDLVNQMLVDTVKKKS